ncbi:MAG: right-handed parallel beta-helix repeat-containing protein [Candidatus Bathyarchaeota archaeon]|nr:right-handed parallel beta-helix repeat-containing protein [Candidatus Bathyarchaeota archaeon]
MSFAQTNVPTSPSIKSTPITVNVTINNDGTVEPSTAPIAKTGNYYYLLSPIVGAISVYKSNIVFDGSQYELTFSGYPKFGFQMVDVFNVTVKNLTISGNFLGPNHGIMLLNASNCMVVNNTVRNIGSIYGLNGVAFEGLYVSGGGSNDISGNVFENNTCAMVFRQTTLNRIYLNTINDEYTPWSVYSTAVFFNEASNNTIYHNNIKNHIGEFISHAATTHSINIWDLGFPSGGNYWGDYYTRYPDAAEIDEWGIANIPYLIDSANIDHYPLTEPYTSATYLLQTTPPNLSLESPRDQAYNTSTVELTFSVDKATNWTGYSLDNQPIVTIFGNTTLANVTNGIHAFILYANDSYGNLGTSSVNFTVALADAEKEQPSVWSLVAVGVVVGVAVVLGLIVYAKKRRQ